MHDAVIIYPHQLCRTTPALQQAAANAWPVYLVEEPLLLTHNPIHRQKLLFHKLTLDAYERSLASAGYAVTRLTITDHPTTTAVFTRLKKDNIKRMHVLDTVDNYLERAINNSGLERVWYETPLFILHRSEAVARYQNSRRLLTRFYKQLRIDKQILVDNNQKPLGGQWSFDADNRQSIPRDTSLPSDIVCYENAEIKAARTWLENVAAEQYGQARCWLPYTHEGAADYLQTFLTERFCHFGAYEDAMHTDGVRLWHAAISPLLNVGLLTPQQVLDAVLTHADTHNIPINSLEGFVRQLIGWREFIRASYECDGSSMRTSNFFNHTRPLPKTFWDGSTGIPPLDHVITTAITYGYTHHIERLMVLGNFMLLTQTNPNDVYRWFMGMYLDAYDWVMVPNVYGMSQFADGGSFATKPYISGANYIKKMSNFSGGDWEETWTALYWHFIHTHKDFFTHNHRLAMMPRLLTRMKPETRDAHLQRAADYLQNEL